MRRSSVWAAVVAVAVAMSVQAAPQSRRLADVATLFERFSGHLAILPGTSDGATRTLPLVHWLRGAGLLQHVKLLSGKEYLDPAFFNAEQFPVALYANGEPYRQTVVKAGDGDQALLRYLGEGGTLLVLPSGPLPFWYNEKSQPARTPAKFGLPIAGAGVDPWPAHLEGVRVSGEGPPKGRTLTFHTSSEQNVVTGLPESFPYPKPSEADQRWRGIVNAPPEGSRYLPVVSLRDDQGVKYGEGVAIIEHDSGRFKGARLAYVWCSLLSVPGTREPILAGLFRYALSPLTPPPARIEIPLTKAQPKLDGRLDDACWTTAARTRRFLPASVEVTQFPQTTARLCWTPTHLCAAFECQAANDAADDSIRVSWAEMGGQRSAAAEIRADGETLGLPAEAQVRCTSDDGRWTAELLVPLPMLGVAEPRIGQQVAVQFARGEVAGDSPQLLWSPAEQFAEGPLGTASFAPDPRGDDFDLYPDGADGTPHWRITSGTWRIEDGAFVGENTGDDGFLAQGAALGDESWTNYELTLRFKVDSYSDNWRDGPRVGFRCNANGDGYHINFNDRSIQTHKSILGTSTNTRNALGTVPWKRDKKWHTLKIRAVKNAFTVSLDGKELYSFQDDMLLNVPSHRTGGIILGARKWTQAKGTMRVRYDDIRMTPLPAPKRWSFE